MKLYEFEQQHGELGQMRLESDGEWIRYTDHIDAMKRIAGEGVAAEPVAWHIGNADGSINKIGAVYIRRSLAEKHIASYEEGEIDASIVPLYATPAPTASTADHAEDARELERLRRISWLIGSIFVHGNFVAETGNERELESLLREQGTFWETLSEFDAAMSMSATPPAAE